MSGHFVAHDAKGYQAYRHVNGLYRLNVGPHFPTPKEAMAYADNLDAASDISPLREHGEPITARPAIPLRDGDRSVGSPSAPRGRSVRSGGLTP